MSNGKRHNDLNILLERFKNGDQLAFDEIYSRCYGHIAFVCSKLCDNKEDVEEIVQDTFMSAFKKADKLRGDTLLGLLRKIAAHGCYDKRKRSKNEHIVFSDEQVEIIELDKDFLPEEYLQNKESQLELFRIINSLPPKQREMIYLYYYADINTEEIAKLNNCSSVNVRKILFTARNTIKSKIEGKADKKSIQRMAVVSLTAVLLMEEEVFAAEYASAGIVSVLDVAGKAAGTTTTVTTNIATIAARLWLLELFR